MIRIKREVFERMLEGYGIYVQCETCICDTRWCRENAGENKSCWAAIMAWLKKENAIEEETETC